MPKPFLASSRTGSSLDAPPQRVGVPDTPIPFAPNMEHEILPDADDIERAVRRVR